MPSPVPEGLLQQIYAVVQERKRRAPQESYVASLMARGQDHVLKKVIEEAAEVLMASKDGESRGNRLRDGRFMVSHHRCFRLA